MKKASSLSFLLCLFFTVTSQAQTAKEYFTKGLYDVTGKNYDSAITEFSQAIVLQPDYVEAWFFRGMIKTLVKDTSSISDLNRAIALQPDHYKAYRYRSYAKFMTKDYTAALTDINKAIELKPDYVEAIAFRSAIEVQQSDWDGSIRDLEKALTLEPNNVAYLYAGGVTLYAKGDFTKAIDWFNKTLEQHSEHYTGKTYYYRALCEQELKMHDATCNDFRSALNAGYQEAQKAIDKYCK